MDETLILTTIKELGKCLKLCESQMIRDKANERRQRNQQSEKHAFPLHKRIQKTMELVELALSIANHFGVNPAMLEPSMTTMLVNPTLETVVAFHKRLVFVAKKHGIPTDLMNEATPPSEALPNAL